MGEIKVIIFVDCNRMESEKHATKITIYENESQIFSGILKKNNCIPIELPFHDPDAILRFHFDVIEKNCETIFYEAEDFTFKEMKAYLSDSNLKKLDDSRLRWGNREGLENEFEVFLEWIYPYDTVIKFLDEVPSHLILYLTDFIVAGGIEVGDILSEVEHEKSVFRNISAKELRKPLYGFYVHLVIYTIISLIVGFALYQIVGGVILTYFVIGEASVGTLALELALFLGIPIAFFKDSAISYYKKYKKLYTTEMKRIESK